MYTVAQKIRDVITRYGPISFDRFMDLALYSPGNGYYRSNIPPIGPAGDYFTSPTAHPVFGALVAVQLHQMWEVSGRPPVFTIVEVGAGNGLLAKDIAEATQFTAPDFSRALRYVSIDYSTERKLSSGIQPIAAANLPIHGLVGCILSNELMDAFPVHRFQVKNGLIQEVFVGLSGTEFVEVLQEPSDVVITDRVQQAISEELPDGYKGEVSLRISDWVTEAASALERGFVLTIDYGGTAAELYSPKRREGTLRCHYEHVVSNNPYIRVGQQDITAHVDFTELKDSGNRCGLEVIGYTTQREFLYNLGIGSYLEALANNSRSRSSYSTGVLPRRQYLANRMGMQELLKLEGLGGFKVMVQGKGISLDALWGFESGNPYQTRVQNGIDVLHVPLLTDRHTPLMEGKYPGSLMEL